MTQGPSAPPPDVDVHLAPIGPGDLEQLRLLMFPREVWRNFGYRTPPTLFSLRTAWRSGKSHGVFFRRSDNQEVFGFALLFGVMGLDADLEYAMAITAPRERGLKLGRKAACAVENYLFSGGLCRVLWAWGDTGNEALLGLIKSRGWAVLGRSKREFVDGVKEVINIRLTAEAWRRSQDRVGTAQSPDTPPK